MIRYFLLFAIFLVFTSLSLKGEATPHGGYTRNPFIPQLPKKKEEPPPVIIQEEIELPVIEKKIENEVKKIIEDIKPKEIPITPPTFTISGIIWNSDRPQAIIDGRVVDIGDNIGEAKIINIQKSNIDVEYKGQYFSISQ